VILSVLCAKALRISPQRTQRNTEKFAERIVPVD
jgi:hypothetical protein